MELQVIQGAFPLLSIIVAVPAVVALILGLVPALRQYGRQIAFWTSLVVLGLIIWAAFLFDWASSSVFQLVESTYWIRPLGITWSMGVNGLGMVMLLLAGVLVPLVLVATPKGDPRREGGYAALILTLYVFIIIIFGAFDLVLFYLAFEAMLVPLYFMIGRYGTGENRSRAAMKFLIYSLVGGLAMLGGLVTIFAYGGSQNGTLFRYDILALMLPTGGVGFQMTVFITLFIAFAIKAPMVPVHTWLPDTAAAARPGTSVLLVGVLDKIGTYGMIVLLLNFVPGAAWQARWTILILAVISILWGGFAANGQKNLLRLVSFTSIAHFGFMVLGIFVGSQIALTGAMFYMAAHGLSVAALFFISGFLIERGGSASIDAYGGMQRVTPVLAGTWLIAGLATIALPGLSGFVPEFLVLMGTWQVSVALAIFAVFGVVLAAMYILLPYQKMFTGPKKERLVGIRDLNVREKLVVTPLIIGMLLLGIWSAPLVESMSQVATSTETGMTISELSEMLTSGEGN